MRTPVGMAMSAVYLVSTTLAAMSFMGGNTILRADDVLERPFSDIVNAAAAPVLGRRQGSGASAAAGDANAVKVNSDGKFNMTAWGIATNDACIKALTTLHRSSNPSGNCICYNLPTLDTVTGVFEADLRLFRVSEPRDAFANIPPEKIRVGVSYQGASVSPVSADELMGMGQVDNETKVVAPRDSPGPSLVQSYVAAFEAVLIPTFTLTATNSTGGTVQTNVSMNEASFLTGVFSKSVVMSDFSAAQAAVTKQLDLLHNGTIAFILPGTQIMIFPIGAIITSIWLGLGLLAYGWGTYERMNYAERYKRNLAGTRFTSTI
ncbi:hypothetical protein H634G_00037 [Metarhizium anisopliae BRIP 53293]|uniref:Uncharacterized protein n=1 Tax=Metarhizium anisopliae BRIP 53293 TaxID=1291518 RepID=A0A0D9PEP4_METAN|nr:hypothetical protein H634G_00037 [Metarhizium anisopliae BRIP 53293]KJK92273.1 hypothetical protein H633G_03821 [Metarhizium anisopliae BRIP 53284]